MCRRDSGFDTHTEVAVSPEDDIELRRINITNTSRSRKTIDVTSYAEVVLNSAAADALSPTATLVGQLIWETSALALGFGIAIISLNAMRVGLLTRFMGVLGVIVGVAVAPILPIDQQGIIRVFWLAALGMLILGRLPSGTPKAWVTGEPEPWPTQQQLREQRAAARGDGDAAAEDGERESPRASRRGAATPPPQAPSPRRPDPAAPGSEHSASKKKKRKRRS